MFDQLLKKVRREMQKCDQQEYLADISPLPSLLQRILISEINKDDTLEMSFLEQSQCEVDFQSATAQIRGHQLECHDRWGRQLQSMALVALKQMVPPQSEKLLVTQVSKTNCAPVGLVEGGNYTVAVAACVSRPKSRARITIGCINPTNQQLPLPTGTAVG